MALQREVTLEHATHTYKHIDGTIYDSVSKVLNSVEPKTDWWSVAGKVAGKGKFSHLKTQQEVFDYWKANGKEATDHGTRLHAMHERYAKEFKLLPEDMEYEKSVRHVADMFKEYYGSEDEATVYSKEFKVAGTMDKCLFVKKGNGLITIADFKTALKTNKMEYYNKNNEYMLYPVEYLQNCKFNRYVLQLSLYGLLAEECCGLKVRDLFIVFIPNGVDEMPYKIPVPYLRTDALRVLENYRAAQEESTNGIIYIEEVTDFSQEIPKFDVL